MTTPLPTRGHDAVRATRLRTFRALSNPAFRTLWIAGWIWYVNRMMEMAALSWLVLELTDSPTQVALVGVFRMAPMFLLGLVAGSLADRFPKKLVMLSTQSVNLTVTCGMLAILMFGTVAPWHAFLSTFLMGLAWSVDFSARRAYFSEIFKADALTNAVSLDVVALTGSSMIGPLLAGLIITVAGFSATYALMVVLFVISFLLLLSVPSTPVTRTATTGVFTQVVEALRMIRSNRVLTAALTITVSLNFFGFPYMIIVPVIGREVLGANALMFGILVAAAGVGSLTGAVVIASRRIRDHQRIYSLGAALMLATLVLFALSEWYLVSVALLIIVGFGMSGFATMQPTIAMQAVAPEMRGRAMGAIALGIGASPLGMIAVGRAAEVFGPQLALAGLAGAGFLVVLLLRYALPELRGQPR